ncbi:hypothetical protein [Paenibacillus sp. 1781tsa1]|uniref:hypothetical protein n=1 Tax=Paenibacillus sp. 1781tsa1 TaxID=2953810 RepID=UPI00209EC4C5|nr:hypothetical protein [Paenibacillus sp. 1781tsa1]MCP1185054.1 hypothetical protein [Paenibacillus sp. 1781tsa1]
MNNQEGVVKFMLNKEVLIVDDSSKYKGKVGRVVEIRSEGCTDKYMISLTNPLEPKPFSKKDIELLD